jgi:N-methylhydantoinase A
MSGPVAGAVGSGHVCRRLGIDLAVTADVGGTSFDTCLVVEGRPRVRYEGSVIGMPLQTPWVDVHSIGAGGGSIATFDAGGLLRVGPQSAGASPGPACYGRGGTSATVTDAACVLGMLGDGRLADGLTLDVAAATSVIEPLAERLGEPVDAAAAGVITIAAANMANAIRVVTLEQGVDPRDATLVAFGGAGPLFCSHLAAELDMERVLVPPHAGNFSAWGLLVQDIAQVGSATFVHALDAEGLAAAETVLDGLAERLRAELDATPGEVVVTHAADLRFVGQEYALTTAAPAPDTFARRDVEGLREAFVAAYRQAFGHVPDAPLEFVSVRATLRVELPRLQPGASPTRGAPAGPATAMPAYSFAERARMRFAVVERAALPAAGVARGPAIVLEPTATTYVDAGYAIAVESDGSLLLTRERS